MDRWELIEKLFQQAADMPAEQRSQFLDRNCQTDSDLRREIESLLASESQSPDFLESHELPSNPLQFVEDGEDPWIGRKVGAWQIERRLGGGGMGQVYLASRADGAFQQKVAIKIVKRGMDTEAVLRRFRAERQTLAQLQHPGIARLLDGGSTEDGLPYLVMEFVDGKPLHQFCDEKRLRIAQRLRLFRQVCLAVEAAHRMQIVHRDLKPGNVLVTAEGTPKLLDFGVAKMLNPDAVDFTLPQTMTGQNFLTPEYASPEQIRGEPVTAASDVYSLGIILFELLTGQRPKRERTEKPSDVITRPKTQEEVTTASWHRGADPERLREMIRGDLEIVAMKALHPEPARRYASAREFAEDLRRYQENLPILARPDTLGYRLQKLAQRRSREFALAGILLVAAGGGWIAIRHYAAVADEKAAAAERASKESDEQKAQLEKLQRELDSATELQAPPTPAPTASASTNRGAGATKGADEKQRQENLVAARSTQAMALWNAAYQDSKSDHHQEAKEKLLHLAIMMQLGVDPAIFPPRWQALTYYKLAHYLKFDGDMDGFSSNLERAAGVYENQRIADPQHPDPIQFLPGLYEQLERYYRESGDKAKADGFAKKTKALLDAAPKKN